MNFEVGNIVEFIGADPASGCFKKGDKAIIIKKENKWSLTLVMVDTFPESSGVNQLIQTKYLKRLGSENNPNIVID